MPPALSASRAGVTPEASRDRSSGTFGKNNMNHDIDIHIEWEGPHSFSEALTKKSEKDYGIYQIYGSHPIYGSDVLLYIGKADIQYFGVRLSQEDWWMEMPDAGRITVYLGRLAGTTTPVDEVWGSLITKAERLLIYAHVPAFNAQKSIRSIDDDLFNVHVFNWKRYRNLFPELSGSRWTSRLGEMPGYHVFDTTENNQAPNTQKQQ